MPTYSIVARKIVEIAIEIEAKDEDKARDKALKALEPLAAWDDAYEDNIEIIDIDEL